MKKRNISIAIPILWGIGTVIWIITVSTRIIAGETQGYLFVLQCGCVLSFGAAAVTNFIRYKRDRKNNDDEH